MNEVLEGEVLTGEFERIAQAMAATRGNIALASRSDTVEHNAMSLRRVVKDNPIIRRRYQELLTEELAEKGLQISERILKLADLQERAFGGEMEDVITGDMVELPPDVRSVLDISKEISRLITEGRMQNMSEKSAKNLVSKENAEEILKKFLES